MKYPYIGKCITGTVLFSSTGVGAVIKKEHRAWDGIVKFEFSDGWDELDFKNITAEYLSNTWGIVESKEHAEFIIELAELHGFKLSGDSSRLGSFFSFSFNGFGFLDFEFIASHDSKQITIPLPPKDESKTPVFHADKIKVVNNAGETILCIGGGVSNPSNIDVKLSAPELPEVGRNLVFADSERKEWPQVGDTVTTRGGSKGVLIVNKPDNDGMVICNFDGEYALTYLSELQKLKTPEDELRDELMIMATQAMHNSDFDTDHNCYYLISGLMKKYNITKKDKGDE